MAFLPKFTPRKWPLGFVFFGEWLVFALVAVLIAPTALVLHTIVGGRLIVGLLAALVWLPLLGHILLLLHRKGIIRASLSIPVVALATLALALSLALPLLP